LDKSPFVMALECATSYLVLRNRNTDLYSRIWCICEVIFPRKFGFIPHKTVIIGPNSFSDSFTSCIDATYYSQIDKTKILKDLVNNHSTDKIDGYIKEFRAFGVLESSSSRKLSEDADLSPARSREENMKIATSLVRKHLLSAKK